MPSFLLILLMKVYEDLFQFISAGKQTDSTISLFITDPFLYKIEGRKQVKIFH